MMGTTGVSNTWQPGAGTRQVELLLADAEEEEEEEEEEAASCGMLGESPSVKEEDLV